MKTPTARIRHLFIILATVFLIISILGGCRSRRHHRSGYMTKHILERVDSRVEELKLTSVQEKKYQDIRQRLKDHLSRGAEARKALFEDFKTEINRSNPDLGAASVQVKERMNRFPEFVGGILDLFMEFYNMLDEEQQAKVIKDLRKAANRH